ncbi:CRISPR-associated endonuclease Cas2 [Methanothermobacter sp. KEPCO-1]|uniref:CRISPR-associated endonuclease Cas2 n=1 Tax=Methanothermobacter sp. KEPCO-1 TaxID=2603820 RepID=UPI0011CC55FC|nr:CRISPR-associated endonuclease Cas2 [Methanothermobacter sp. KEPCO-1]QEF94772.1 CRISPR-associated endonuclease Cas2 [Methanothermobacter sp. KEPCO-1]
MYLLIVYDVGVERVNRVKSYLRTELHWVQNSVFEGEVTGSQFRRIEMNLKRIIDEDRDSVVIYSFRSESAVKRNVLGVEKSPLDVIL